MTKRIFAIVFIFVCASMAWAILGGTIFSRTYDSGASSSGRVESTWGTAQNQAPPTASFTTEVLTQEETFENGHKTVKTVKTTYATPLSLESSKIDVNLDLEH